MVQCILVKIILNLDDFVLVRTLKKKKTLWNKNLKKYFGPMSSQIWCYVIFSGYGGSGGGGVQGQKMKVA